VFEMRGLRVTCEVQTFVPTPTICSFVEARSLTILHIIVLICSKQKLNGLLQLTARNQTLI